MASSMSAPTPALSPPLTRLVKWLQQQLPEGRPLPVGVWRRRHRGIVILLWLHVLGLTAFGVLAGYGIIHVMTESGMIVVATVAASLPQLPRRARAAVASLGLLTASAILVHFSGGYIEMHFHFFVALVIIALYQDWIPFLLAIGYVVVEHGVLGMLAPQLVYNHPDGWAHPWKWASIHGAFVLAGSVASLINWRLAETALARTELLLESAGEGICGIDCAGLITFVNAMGARMVGRDAAACIGQPFETFGWQPGTAPPMIARGTLLPHDSAQRVSESVFYRADGTSFPVEYVSTPIRERDVTVGQVVTFRDITERRQIAAERARLQEEEAQAQIRAQEVVIQLQARALADLATPVIPVSDQIIVMPLIGMLDAQRAQQVVETLLCGIETHRSQIAILDITGVPVVDRNMAHMLVQTAQAGRLLGTEVVLTGIRPEVAQSLISIGSDLRGMTTQSTLQSGIGYALHRAAPGSRLARGMV
jgi:PAS domain S-box-containing protein